MRDLFVICSVAGVLAAAAVMSAAPQAPPRDTVIRESEGFIILEQLPYRTIHLRRSAVTGFVAYPNGFSDTGKPAIVVITGAREFRLDVPGDKVDDVSKAILGTPND